MLCILYPVSIFGFDDVDASEILVNA